MAKKDAEIKEETKQEEIKVETEVAETKPTEVEKIVEASKVAQKVAEVKKIFWGFQAVQNPSPFQMNTQIKRIWDALCNLNDRVEKLEK